MDVPQSTTENGAGGANLIHDPFTKAERMQQLSEIDRDITSLLEITSQALSALLKPPPQQQPPSLPDSDSAAPISAGTTNPGDTPTTSTDQQRRAFESATDAFFTTLHSVHVRLKRQIWGLEEAGIISLRDGSSVIKGSAGAGVGGSGGPSGPGLEPPSFTSTIEPNGAGTIGNLDVGWLNSRSSKVDRDMEAELWGKARTHLESLAASFGVAVDPAEDGGGSAVGGEGSDSVGGTDAGDYDAMIVD